MKLTQLGDNNNNNSNNNNDSSHQASKNTKQKVTNNNRNHKKSQQQKKRMKWDDRQRTQFNIKKSDLVRVMIQALQSLDLSETASMLERESGIQLHDPSIAKMRSDILHGEWDSVMNHLEVLGVTSDESFNSVQFLVARQKYLECLEKGQLQSALKTLREELTPVCRDSNQLHKLACLVICSDVQSLKTRAKWDGSTGNSRKELINDLHRYIPAHLMVPENQLEKLMLQAVQYQKDRGTSSTNILTSSIGSDISLLSEDVHLVDHVPRDLIRVLHDHTDEVWFAQFSPNGRYLSTCSADGTALIYDLSLMPDVWKHLGLKKRDKVAAASSDHAQNSASTNTNHVNPVVCSGHNGKITHLAWSPNSDRLLTVSDDVTINLYDTQGKKLHTFQKHEEGICAVRWSPDGSFFVSGGVDRKFVKWDARTFECLGYFLSDYRIQDFDLDPVSGDIICAVSDNLLHVFQLSDSSIQFTLQDSGSISSVQLSHDGRYALCSLSSNSSSLSKATLAENEADGVRLTPEELDKIRAKIHLWDLRDRRMIKEYTGHEQSKYVLRCCFSAYPRRLFVCSGSEDGGVYIWNTDDGALVKDMPLKGHTGTVNCVCWNNSGRVMASVGDDATVRIYARVDRVKEI